tara:strand:- start:159 stop:293 length:135 start_codon:yes stop_codon:yes gene_type:complete
MAFEAPIKAPIKALVVSPVLSNCEESRTVPDWCKTFIVVGLRIR